jgi:phage terminase large subunit-like protein
VTLTARQIEAQRVMAGPASHVLAYGGSRSGKTRLIVRALVIRALKAPRSRHAILRFRFNHVKASIGQDTLPAVMAQEFPDVSLRLNREDWIGYLPNGSELWLGGLDDKDRTEKILGLEFATVFLNEVSQIPWGSREMAVTRLAQRVIEEVDGQKRQQRLRMYYDCNPPSKAHWSYRLFIEKRDPETKRALPNPEDYAAVQINPGDNSENLPREYLASLASLTARAQRRFLLGEFGDATPGALFAEDDIDKWRVTDGRVPDMVRVVVAVDPSGSGDEDNADNDAIGIVVAGLGTDGNGYLLEDATVKAGPATWGRVATDAWERHEGDCVVGEVNYGGEMVRHVIQTARPKTPFRKVTATRGKAVRAEPLSALVEQGKIRHVGMYPDLEEELAGFTTTGYRGDGSPNRADAWVWAFTELFGGMVKPRDDDKPRVSRHRAPVGAGSWMGA